MSEPFVNDATPFVSLLIEHSHGTMEVILRRVELHGVTGLQPIESKRVSGSRPVELTHSCIGSAISMQKWSEDHPAVFSEGLTSPG